MSSSLQCSHWESFLKKWKLKEGWCTHLIGLPQQNTTDWVAETTEVYLFSHSSGGWESQIKVLSELVPGGITLSAWQMASFSVGPHRALCCARTQRVVSLVFLPFITRTLVPSYEDTTLITEFNLNSSLKALSLNIVTIQPRNSVLRGWFCYSTPLAKSFPSLKVGFTPPSQSFTPPPC